MVVLCVVGCVVCDCMVALLEDGSVGFVASMLTVLADGGTGVVSGFVMGSEGSVAKVSGIGVVGVGACVVVAGGTVERLGLSS